MSDYKYTPEEQQLQKSDNPKVLITGIVSTLAAVLILGGGGYWLYQSGQNANKSSSSTSSLASISLSSSKSSSSTSSTVSSSSVASSSVANSSSTSSVSSSSVASSSSQASSSVANSAPVPGVARYTDIALPGFSVGLVNSWQFENKALPQGLGQPFRYKFYMGNSTLTVNIYTDDLAQGNFVDWPLTDNCVPIGNTWNRCAMRSGQTGNLIGGRRDYYVNKSNTSTIMRSTEYTDILTPNLKFMTVQYEFDTSVSGVNTQADDIVSSIIF